jgi:hypothetical protein
MKIKLSSKHKLIFLCAVAGVLITGMIYAAELYRINKGQINLKVDEYGLCKKVSNSSVLNDYFIPTKTATEWNSFLANHPADLAVKPCCSNVASSITRSVLDSAGDVGRYTSIQAYDANNIYIAYYDVTNGDLKFAKSINGGANWSISTIDSIGDVGQNAVLKLIGSNTLVIAYYDITNTKLKFAKSTNQGSTWARSFVNDPDGYRIENHFDMDFINANNIYIVYRNQSDAAIAPGELRLVETYNGGTTWNQGYDDSYSQSSITEPTMSIAFDSVAHTAKAYIVYAIPGIHLGMSIIDIEEYPVGSGQYQSRYGSATGGGYFTDYGVGASGVQIKATGTRGYFANAGVTGGCSSYSIQHPEFIRPAPGTLADNMNPECPSNLFTYCDSSLACKSDPTCFRNCYPYYYNFSNSLDVIDRNIYMTNIMQGWVSPSSGIRGLVLWVSNEDGDTETWYRNVVDFNTSSSYVGLWNSVKTIDCKLTFISYYDSINGDLKFAKVTFPAP